MNHRQRLRMDTKEDNTIKAQSIPDAVSHADLSVQNITEIVMPDAPRGTCIPIRCSTSKVLWRKPRSPIAFQFFRRAVKWPPLSVHTNRGGLPAPRVTNNWPHRPAGLPFQLGWTVERPDKKHLGGSTLQKLIRNALPLDKFILF